MIFGKKIWKIGFSKNIYRRWDFTSLLAHRSTLYQSSPTSICGWRFSNPLFDEWECQEAHCRTSLFIKDNTFEGVNCQETSLDGRNWGLTNFSPKEVVTVRCGERKSCVEKMSWLQVIRSGYTELVAKSKSYVKKKKKLK